VRTIVVGVDDSAEGRAALTWALREAALSGMPVRAVRAWTSTLSAAFPAGVFVGASDSDVQDAAAALAATLVEDARVAADAVDVSVRAVSGLAGPVLVEATAGADLLVVGTRGAGRISRALLGSVTEHVLRHALCPVAVVPALPSAAGSVRRVVVGVDHSPESLRALAWGADAAVRRHWPLVPVCVREGSVERPDRRSLDGASLAGLEERERRALRALVADDVTVAVEPDVAVGHAGKLLVQAAGPQDLLVVGRQRGGHHLRQLLGSTSSYVAEHAAAPVVVVAGDDLLTAAPPQSAGAGGATWDQAKQVGAVDAVAGEVLVVVHGGSERRADVLRSDGPNGGPPFLVRWPDTGAVEQLVPDYDCYVRAAPRVPRPRTSATASRLHGQLAGSCERSP
jgi:nucleotide-binding universal stress UspA family protein